MRCADTGPAWAQSEVKLAVLSNRNRRTPPALAMASPLGGPAMAKALTCKGGAVPIKCSRPAMTPAKKRYRHQRVSVGSAGVGGPIERSWCKPLFPKIPTLAVARTPSLFPLNGRGALCACHCGYRPFLLHPWEQLNPEPCKLRTPRWPEVPRRARLARDVLNKVVANLTMQVSPVPIHCCKARWSLARRLKPLVQSVPIQVRRMCK